MFDEKLHKVAIGLRRSLSELKKIEERLIKQIEMLESPWTELINDDPIDVEDQLSDALLDFEQLEKDIEMMSLTLCRQIGATRGAVNSANKDMSARWGIPQ